MTKEMQIIYLFVFCIATACSSERGASTKADALPDQIVGTYQGTLPCEHCESIQFDLKLHDNARFNSTSLFVGTNTPPQPDSGYWYIEDSIITLERKEAAYYQFVVETEDKLRMLSPSGQAGHGKDTSAYILQKLQQQSTDEGKNTHSQSRSRGVDFVAFGNEPSWILEVDSEEMVIFKPALGDSLQIPVEEPQMKGKEQLYEVETATLTAKISITEEPCTDSMSGEKFSHSIHLRINEQEYQGCGRYLVSDKMSYEGRWRLAVLAGENLGAATLQDAPHLEISSAGQAVSGFSGCNLFRGSLSVEGDSIRFSELKTGRKACPTPVEEKFLTALQQANTYQLQEGQLLLIRNEEVLMVLSKE